jgi:hypothetical protein
MYVKMPFGLMNAGATFQRAMDIAFVEESGKFIVVYLDDVTVFSRSDDEHLRHLRRVFEKCRRFGISLNPKKILFGLEEGKLLGHIISKDGIKIDPSRIEAIQKLEHPRNLKELQSFIGRINFLRRFIPNLAELLRNITNMLKKDVKIKWDSESRQSFEQVKRALTEAPVLISPDFTKDFYLFSFASEHTIAAVLLQKNSEGYEQPIAFFSKALRDAALNYKIMEKQAFALVKAIKDFRVYILHSHTIAYVQHSRPMPKHRSCYKVYAETRELLHKPEDAHAETRSCYTVRGCICQNTKQLHGSRTKMLKHRAVTQFRC